MRKSQLIDAIRAAQRDSGATASSDGGEQDNGHRSHVGDRRQDDRPDSGNIVRALDEPQESSREAASQREEAQMPEQPVQPDLMSASPANDTTTGQRQERVAAGDGGQVIREETTTSHGVSENAVTSENHTDRTDQVREDTSTQQESAGDGQRESNRSEEQTRSDERAPEGRAGDGERGDGSRDGRQNERRDRRNPRAAGP
jgi:hypothetical protein